MDTIEYVVSLRQELIDLLSGIENSKSYADWDNTTPNYIIKNRLVDTYNRFMEMVSCHGVYLAERHSFCEYPNHSEEYVTVLINGERKRIEYLCNDYIWDGSQMDQGERLCVCPCSPDKPAKKHYVIEDIIYLRSTDTKIGESIYRVLLDVHSAIKQAKDKRPRSGIREYLLRAILRLNDLILQKPMDIIAARMKDASDSKKRPA